MARARLLKPGFFTNEGLAELPFTHRLTFAGLWTLADRAGRLEDRPKRIKLGTLPFDDVDIDQILADLNHHGFIQRYLSNGQRFIVIPTFQKHQHPHANEPSSNIPEPTMSDVEPTMSDALRRNDRSGVLIRSLDPESESESVKNTDGGTTTVERPIDVALKNFKEKNPNKLKSYGRIR